jgi:3-hydroxyisobutyrate dehydrogenase-like beta-hydroxyacid dehydrogenase
MERITFIGFGEAGQTIGRGLLGATAARQQWLADLKVREQLGGRRTEDRAELVREIRKALGRG